MKNTFGIEQDSNDKQPPKPGGITYEDTDEYYWDWQYGLPTKRKRFISVSKQKQLEKKSAEVMNELNTKPSNPKDSVGVKKVPFSTIPAPVLAEVGLAMLEGARKYGRHNYRIAGVRSSVYYDALLRHITAWWEGQDIDPDSGLPHVVKAMACLVVLRDSQLLGNVIDDRPPSHKDNWQEELNAKAAELIEKYPNPKEAFTKEV